jgi:hypothetical protein
MPCWVTEKAPDITAWLATMVASVAMITKGSRNQSGASRKKGLVTVEGSAISMAPCPI